jgi:hypothetical protein
MWQPWPDSKKLNRPKTKTMKKIIASMAVLLSSSAFAATISLPPKTVSVPFMDNPATILLVAILLAFGIRYLRANHEE